jgi:Cu(I)/Ag(I) efflux system membrane fusion protein
VPIRLDRAGLELAGVRLRPAAREAITPVIRGVATVVPDEGRIWHVHARVSGWIEAVLIHAVGEQVRAGQPLALIFSQDLYASQMELLAALHQTATEPKSAVIDAARTRLQVLGMTNREIESIEQSGEARRLVTVIAPADGVVLRRLAWPGMAVDPSTELIAAADLSRVWAIVEIAESQAAGVSAGAGARVHFPGAGTESIEGPVTFVHPTLTERTRTVRVRIELPNPAGRLRPGMYGSASIRGVPREAVTVPRDALVDTGNVQYVFVRVGEGEFEPRPVSVGLRMDDRIEIVAGLAPQEMIVASGVFLLDSESRLRSGGIAGHGGHGTGAASDADARRTDAGSSGSGTTHKGHER